MNIHIVYMVIKAVSEIVGIEYETEQKKVHVYINFLINN
jgi:hypothetical protein